MRIAAMQPYLFPYIGYFQLINAAEVFYIDDEVQFIEKGWINRNRYLHMNKDDYFTFSLKRDSHKLKIKERFFNERTHALEKTKFLKMLNNYRRAPHYPEVIELIKHIMQFDEANVATFISHSLREVCAYLDMQTPIKVLSQIPYETELKLQERVIDMCHRLNADWYVNAIGGMALYSKEDFAREGIKLNFIKTRDIRYEQFDSDFIPHLSIIDVLMFNSKAQVQELLTQYDLI